MDLVPESIGKTIHGVLVFATGCEIAFMQSSIKLGHVFGVEIGLHYSWFIIAALVALSLGITGLMGPLNN